MKKAFSIFLLFFFVLNTIGIEVYAHFCGKNFVNASIQLDQDNCCGSKQTPKDCCKDQVIKIKISENYLNQAKENLIPGNTILNFSLFTFESPFHVSFDTSINKSHSKIYALNGLCSIASGREHRILISSFLI